METINILTTRALSDPDAEGQEKEVVLTIFMPYEAATAEWRCGFELSLPFRRKGMDLRGVDFIQAFMTCLSIARVFLETTRLRDRAHWQGMLDCGLPSVAETKTPRSWANVPPPEANPGNMSVLTMRRMGYRDVDGVERESLLTVFAPFQAEGETWKCAFAFGPPESAPVRYGVGADFLEALLDSLSLARAVFEGELPEGWAPSASPELDGHRDLPYKIGRSFWTSTRAMPCQGSTA